MVDGNDQKLMRSNYCPIVPSEYLCIGFGARTPPKLVGVDVGDQPWDYLLN